MAGWTLDVAPPLLHDDARAGWTTPTTARPAAGEIWLLTWNGRPESLVLVTSVYADFVRAMPLTLGDQDATPDEALLDTAVLGTPATVWFHAETGLGDFLLHRRIASGVSTEHIRRMRESAYTGAAPSFPHGAGDPADTAESRQHVLALFQRLCYLDWPTARPGEGLLIRDTLEAAGMDIHRFADVTAVSNPVAFELWAGERPVPAAVVVALEAALETGSDQFLKASRDAATGYLRSTELKELVSRVAVATGRDELEVRNDARSSYALAARTTNITGRELVALRETLEAALPTRPDDA